MKTVEQQLYDFIDDQEHYELITRNGITISVPDIDVLGAEFTWLDTDDACLSVNFRCEKKGFVDALEIRKVQNIHVLTPGKLIEVYNEGLAELVCFVALDCTYCMSFQKQGDIIVVENDRGFKHIPLYEKLETPEQFIDYARRYYKQMESNEKWMN